jgi:uncharacterized protein (UPF0332 family)
MVKSLKQDIPELLSQSESSLGAARLLYENEYYAESVSRAYYAMFYAATALLHSRDIAVSKHSAVISQVGQHFVKTGKIEAHLHRALIDAFDQRQTADYGGILISDEDSKNALQAAEQFIQAVQEYLWGQK